MSWRSEHIWIELITGSRKLSNFCWALIVFLSSIFVGSETLDADKSYLVDSFLFVLSIDPLILFS